MKAIDTKNFNDSVMTLVNLAWNNLQEESVQRYKEFMPVLQFIDQFATVKVKLPRGMGHTTTALNLFMKYSPALIIEPNLRMVEHTERMMREVFKLKQNYSTYTPNPDRYIHSFRALTHGKSDWLRGVTFNIAIVDTASGYDYLELDQAGDKRQELYLHLQLVNKVQLFVELG